MLIFREEQGFRQKWIWAIVLGTSALLLGTFGFGMVEQFGRGRPWGTNPMSDTGLAVAGAISCLLAIALPWFFVKLRLVTEVAEHGVGIRLRPFRGQTIPFTEIKTFRPVTFRPIRDHGGWGVRYFKGGKAYTVSGNSGVALVLTSGKIVVIGSRQPDDLVQAITRKMR